VSHNVIIRAVRIASKDVALRAVEELARERGFKYTVSINGYMRGWNGSTQKIKGVAVSIEGYPYDLGLLADENGQLTPVYEDLVSGAFIDAFGSKNVADKENAWSGKGRSDHYKYAIGGFIQRANVIHVEDTCAAQGYRTDRSIDTKTGNIMIVAETY